MNGTLGKSFILYRIKLFSTYSIVPPSIGLGLTLWEGEFEARQDSWLRCYEDGTALKPPNNEPHN
ncbi:hypothetical protein [Rivularia sp. PCC 7116]|uniref:hypothetical protein n=1 Tax=Rivularia sp. PCC 7116 TaxID=373994 RepID=UPI00031F56FF